MRQVPDIELKLGEPEFVVAMSRKNHLKKKEISKADRERTPQRFAEFLLAIARSCKGASDNG